MITQANKELLSELLKEVKENVDDYDFDYENKNRREVLASEEFQDNPEDFDIELLQEVENKPHYFLKWQVAKNTSEMAVYHFYFIYVLDSEGEFVYEKPISKYVATLLNTKDFILRTEVNDYDEILYTIDIEKLTLYLK